MPPQEYNEEVKAENNDEIYLELLIGIRIQRKDQQKFLVTVKTIHQIISNICENPSEVKFHKLKMLNEAIKAKITDFESAVWLMEFVGFDQKPIEMIPHFVLDL